MAPVARYLLDIELCVVTDGNGPAALRIYQEFDMTDRRSPLTSLIIPQRYLCALVALAGALYTAQSQAQEICSEADVQTALSGLPCVADGVYLSPDAIASRISDQCGEAETIERCERCFKKSLKKTLKLFKDLSRGGLIERGWIDSLRAAIEDTSDETCSAIQDPADDGDEDDHHHFDRDRYNEDRRGEREDRRREDREGDDRRP